MSESPGEFERAAAEARDRSLAGEFYDFLRHNKRWWLAPIVIVLLLMSLLILLSGTAAAPFIYPMF